MAIVVNGANTACDDADQERADGKLERIGHEPGRRLGEARSNTP